MIDALQPQDILILSHRDTHVQDEIFDHVFFYSCGL